MIPAGEHTVPVDAGTRRPILVVEDNPEDLELTIRILKKARIFNSVEAVSERGRLPGVSPFQGTHQRIRTPGSCPPRSKTSEDERLRGAPTHAG